MTKKNCIAFQGVAGAHADLACRTAFPYMDTVSYASFDEVFKSVENDEAAMCMIPIENTQAGRVAEIHNLLPETNLYIVKEHFQKIGHVLAAPKGSTLKTVTAVYSHPQAFMQSRKFLNKHKYHREPYANTAIAARDVAEWKDITRAAVCSRLAADLYGLEVLEEGIEDKHDNCTIFVAMAKEPVDPDGEGNVVTSFLFTLRNIPAALYKALGGFATNGVNLLKIESYIPGGLSETAQFFITFEGSPTQRNVQLAVEELGFFSKKVKMLGVYPADPMRYRKEGARG